MPPSAPTSKPRAKRGRKPNAAKWLTLDQVAEILRCDVGMLERLLERVPETFPGAIQGNNGWEVPERGLRVFMGVPSGPLPQWVTVEDVSQALRRSIKTIYRWLGLVRTDGKPFLPHFRKAGRIYMLASDVLALPEELPESGRASSFFSDAGGDHEK